jgi:hypothetical protein
VLVVHHGALHSKQRPQTGKSARQHLSHIGRVRDANFTAVCGTRHESRCCLPSLGNKMQMHDNNAAKPYRTPLIASAMSSWNMTWRAKVALLRQSLRYRKPAEEGE